MFYKSPLLWYDNRIGGDFLLDKKTEETVLKIAYGVREYGGTAYFVGGFVRDRLMGADSTDVDIEVHGIKPKILEKILDSLGNRLEIGKSFGIYSICK